MSGEVLCSSVLDAAIAVADVSSFGDLTATVVAADPAMVADVEGA